MGNQGYFAARKTDCELVKGDSLLTVLLSRSLCQFRWRELYKKVSGSAD